MRVSHRAGLFGFRHALKHRASNEIFCTSHDSDGYQGASIWYTMAQSAKGVSAVASARSRYVKIPRRKSFPPQTRLTNAASAIKEDQHVQDARDRKSNVPATVGSPIFFFETNLRRLFAKLDKWSSHALLPAYGKNLPVSPPMIPARDFLIYFQVILPLSHPLAYPTHCHSP